MEEFYAFIKTQPQDKAGVMLWALHDSKTGSTCEHTVDFQVLSRPLRSILPIKIAIRFLSFGDGIRVTGPLDYFANPPWAEALIS